MKLGRILLGCMLALPCLTSGGAAAQQVPGIPTSERTVLLNLYASTNGANWTTRTNWNGAALTECTWYGVTCNSGGTRVTSISLDANNLIGTLPANLAALTNLTVFTVSINKLTGPIPALAGLTNLTSFDVGGNQLTGAIPTLAGLTNLSTFAVDENRLTGPIPALTGLTNLRAFIASVNQLTGAIPTLTGLTNLVNFNVRRNQLTGTIPVLADLTKLESFGVADNLLIGNAPSVPNPNRLAAGSSGLCPNFLNHTPDPAWDAATNQTPWYTNCAIAPQVGLWWNPAESGTGYALDFKHGVLVVTVYSYTASGPPIWYLASGPVTNNTFTATLDKYQGGQCIFCTYRPTEINGNDGTISIFFTSPTSAMMTLPGGRNVQIIPQDF
jgi:Leucine-rich repeat (LRR) protein